MPGEENEGESHVRRPRTPAAHGVGAGDGVPAGQVPCWSRLYQVLERAGEHAEHTAPGPGGVSLSFPEAGVEPEMERGSSV